MFNPGFGHPWLIKLLVLMWLWSAFFSLPKFSHMQEETFLFPFLPWHFSPWNVTDEERDPFSLLPSEFPREVQALKEQILAGVKLVTRSISSFTHLPGVHSSIVHLLGYCEIPIYHKTRINLVWLCPEKSTMRARCPQTIDGVGLGLLKTTREVFRWVLYRNVWYVSLIYSSISVVLLSSAPILCFPAASSLLNSPMTSFWILFCSSCLPVLASLDIKFNVPLNLTKFNAT